MVRDQHVLRDMWMRRVLVGDGCWEWTGHIGEEGYGILRNTLTSNRAHRIGYEFLTGPIPDGLTLDHLCRNRSCVRPDHLEPVTRGENTRRGLGGAAHMRARTHCPQGHPYDDANTHRRRGSRDCRACNRDRQRRRRNSMKEAA